MTPPTNRFSSEEYTRAIEANLFDHSLRFGQIPGGQSYDGHDVKWAYTGRNALNRIFAARFDEDATENRIRELLSYYQENTCAVGWILGPTSRPSCLDVALAHAGFQPGGEWIGMAMDLQLLPETLPLPRGLEVLEITDPNALREWAHLARKPPDDPRASWDDFHQVFTGLGVGEHLPWRYYLGQRDGEVVARSMVHFGAGAAGLYWVKTAEAARRQGIGTALTWHALHQARLYRYDLGILQASVMGEPVYRRLGFREYCRMPVYVWRPEQG